MSDDLTSLFLKKLTELEKTADKGCREDVLSHINKLKQWLAGDRSLQQHKCCQAYMTFLWQSYGDEYKSREGFVMRLKSMLGFADVKEKRFLARDGSKCRDRMISIKSLSFADCTQKAHQLFFDELKEYALKQWGVVFQDWYEHWSGNENTM
jgi:hypothetical protein